MRTKLVAWLLWAAALSAATQVFARSGADEYPDQPIRLVVPSGAGGITDVLARVLGEKLGTLLKQSVIVENRPGASGIIGSSFVARAKPDGYTLLMSFPSHVANPGTTKHLPYDTAKDFAPITKVGSVAEILLINTSGKVRNVKSLIDLAKKSPGKLSYGSVGAGSLGDLAALLLQSQAGIQTLGVSYKSEPEILTALIRGDIDFAFISPPAAIPMLNAGKVKALAISDRNRSPMLPDLPSLAESGLPGYDVTGWNAIFAPAGTPPEILLKLNKAINQVLSQPALDKQFLAQGVRPIGCSPEELQRSVVNDIASIGKALAAAGVSPK